MKFIDSTDSVTVFIDGRNQTFRNTNLLYSSVCEAIENNDEEAVRQIIKNGMIGVLDGKITKQGDFEISSQGVKWRGIELHSVLVDKIKELIAKKSKTLDNYVQFLERLYENPSKCSVDALFDFLGYQLLPITEDGYFLAYKGLSTDFYSITGNKQTIVLSGKVDDSGRIYNGIGESISVARNQVDDNPNNNCSYGLHVGSWDYASSFGSVVVAVKVNPRDVVSVPKDCECQKLRCCAYIVVQEIKEKVSFASVDTSKGSIESNDSKEQTKIVLRILGYLNRKPDGATLKQVQSALKVGSITCKEIEKIVLDNGGTIEYSSALSESIAKYSE